MVVPASYDDIEAFEELDSTCISPFENNDVTGCATTGNMNYFNSAYVYLTRIETDAVSPYIYVKHTSRLLKLSENQMINALIVARVVHCVLKIIV